MLRTGIVIPTLLTAALFGCAAPLAAPSGERSVVDATSNAIKTTALRHALEELSRSTGSAGTRYGIYLDTMVGPTPKENFFEYVHPRDWLDSMVAEKLVDGLIGPVSVRQTVQRAGFSISMGEPYLAGRDTVEIVYAWCVRRFPTQSWAVANGGIWRDAMLLSDSGWTRIKHSPAMVSIACMH